MKKREKFHKRVSDAFCDVIEIEVLFILIERLLIVLLLVIPIFFGEIFYMYPWT